MHTGAIAAGAFVYESTEGPLLESKSTRRGIDEKADDGFIGYYAHTDHAHRRDICLHDRPGRKILTLTIIF